MLFPDGDRFAFGQEEGQITQYNIHTGTIEKTFPGHSGNVWSIAISRGGRLLASGSEDRTVRIWDFSSPQRSLVSEQQLAPIISVDLSPDGQILASAGNSGIITLWSTASFPWPQGAGYSRTVPMAKRKTYPGFTLVELLVVIAVIAILAGMLLPALGKAKAKAQGIFCLNNQRQMALAWIMYADDNLDRIPPNQPRGRFRHSTWVQGWLNYVHPVTDNTNTVYLQESHIGPYINALAPWRCPSDKSLSQHGGKWLPRVRTTAMNNWLNPNEAYQRGFKVYRKITDMVDPPPHGIWVFLDEREDRINNGYFIVDMRGYAQQDPRQYHLGDLPGSYHNGAAALAFADGHAITHRWEDPRTKPPIVRGQSLLISSVSPRNPDVAWLQQHSTRAVPRTR